MGSISYTCEALSDLKGQKQVVEAVVHTAHKMGVARLASTICHFSSDFCGAWLSRFRARRICMEHSEKGRNEFPLANVRRGNSDIEGSLTQDPLPVNAAPFTKSKPQNAHVRKNYGSDGIFRKKFFKTWVAIMDSEMSQFMHWEIIIGENILER
jgi:hypothetical protein